MKKKDVKKEYNKDEYLDNFEKYKYVESPRTSDSVTIKEEKQSIENAVKFVKKKKVKITTEAIENAMKECKPPPNFYEAWNGRYTLNTRFYAGILQMRKNRDAPVDSAGCHCLAEREADEKTRSECMERLKNLGLTIDNIKTYSEEELENILKGVSFHRTKAKNMKKLCDILESQYKKDIPHNLEDLCSLPGIGPKMGILAMKCVRFDLKIIIPRRGMRLKWVSTKTPEETCLALPRVIPKDLWSIFNETLVGFGQQICKAIPLVI